MRRSSCVLPVDEAGASGDDGAREGVGRGSDDRPILPASRAAERPEVPRRASEVPQTAAAASVAADDGAP
ncbi:hypothetical protein GCM10010972_17180 [Cellulomonas carbonis]|nr:hypothetical protein GCM10010972_17180 [Cellulomonas carbonis]